MSKNNGGQAFPRASFYCDDGPSEYDQEPQDGMSLRDWFAGQALAGMQTFDCNNGTAETQALAAYRYADAMLKAREESNDQ